MSEGGASQRPRPAGRTAAVGAVVAIYTFLDSLVVGLPIVLLAAWFNALIVFVVTVVVVSFLDLAACRWLDRT